MHSFQEDPERLARAITSNGTSLWWGLPLRCCSQGLRRLVCPRQFRCLSTPLQKQDQCSVFRLHRLPYHLAAHEVNSPRYEASGVTLQDIAHDASNSGPMYTFWHIGQHISTDSAQPTTKEARGFGNSDGKVHQGRSREDQT